jgi:glycine dehydrogenase
MSTPFAKRHIGVQSGELTTMLQTIGISSIDTLIDETIPDDIRLKKAMNLPEAMSENELLTHLEELSQKNQLFSQYIGLGYHPSITPSVIKRNILENPGWYTAYTPYQAEIAQGRLEALLNYQTMVIELTGMEIANASLLDESTAAAEAMTMLFDLRSRDQKKREALKFYVDSEILPQTYSLLQTRATPLEIELVQGPIEDFKPTDSYFGVIAQYPGKYGNISDLGELVAKSKELDIKVAVAADLLSLTLLKEPGSYGVDAVVGTTQRFGIPLGYGGPHAAYFATKHDYRRNVPGRIIGKTVDTDGNPALRMALQTREQHIKRDKATSNICTAQVLLAVMAGMYSVYHGPDGLKSIASNIHRKTQLVAEEAAKAGIFSVNEEYFDTLYFNSVDAAVLKQKAEAASINLYYPSANEVSISLNEATSTQDLQKLIEVLTGNTVSIDELNSRLQLASNPSLKEANTRTSSYLEHEVFQRYRSETELMRYIKRLEKKDLALNHSMIALGSCTMKLNAATEMLPLSWSRFANLHPFVPVAQAEGYRIILEALTQYLNEVTGFAATSLQPNSGAQGEYAGLMTIRAYHHARGDQHRNICIIPASAHGTNPASAVMAGMKVVVTKTDEKGNIDLADLEEKVIQHSNELAALMVTYPSTHGVFESSIRQITALIHEHGGQVYMDGANMNAQVGLTNPATIGADVCHLNLHKTFAIPHGGGGPGVGPICVASQLAPYLPGNPIIPTGGTEAITAISAAPFGSALACLISYAYIRMLGSEGLTDSTRYAILNANYIKARLEDSYPVLYTGEKGRAAHELIIDCRPFKEKGIEVTDIAKRLMDYGFHAPTVSFPVAGTMMIEPTESEGLEEIDRFCEAMLAIKDEIDHCDADDPENLLKNAPHTLAMLTTDKWEFPYSRRQAAYPLPFVEESKFWPSVRRADEAFGDRNLICSCAPIEAYQS